MSDETRPEEHYIVIRELHATDPKGAEHFIPCRCEETAREKAAALARKYPRTRFSVYRLTDTCKAEITEAKWDRGSRD